MLPSSVRWLAGFGDHSKAMPIEVLLIFDVVYKVFLVFLDVYIVWSRKLTKFYSYRFPEKRSESL